MLSWLAGQGHTSALTFWEPSVTRGYAFPARGPLPMTAGLPRAEWLSSGSASLRLSEVPVANAHHSAKSRVFVEETPQDNWEVCALGAPQNGAPLIPEETLLLQYVPRSRSLCRAVIRLQTQFMSAYTLAQALPSVINSIVWVAHTTSIPF